MPRRQTYNSGRPSYNWQQQEEQAFHALVQSPENPQGVDKETLIQWQRMGNRLVTHPALKDRMNPKPAAIPGSPEAIHQEAQLERDRRTIAGPKEKEPKPTVVTDESGQQFEESRDPVTFARSRRPINIIKDGGVHRQFEAKADAWKGFGADGTPWTMDRTVLGEPVNFQEGKTPKPEKPEKPPKYKQGKHVEIITENGEVDPNPDALKMVNNLNALIANAEAKLEKANQDIANYKSEAKDSPKQVALQPFYDKAVKLIKEDSLLNTSVKNWKSRLDAKIQDTLDEAKSFGAQDPTRILNLMAADAPTPKAPPADAAQPVPAPVTPTPAASAVNPVQDQIKQAKDWLFQNQDHPDKNLYNGVKNKLLELEDSYSQPQE